MNAIYSIDARINHSPYDILQFEHDRYEYQIEVPEDCFAIKLCLQYDPAFRISVTADHDAGRYGYEQLDGSMGDYYAGSEVPFYEYYNGYIVRLDKRQSAFDQDMYVNIYITAGNEAYGTETYHITVRRSCGRHIRELFNTEWFHDDEFNLDLPYALYVPNNYDPAKKYPLMVALHGTGEMKEPIEAILEKTQIATIWAKESERGHNECIVLAPQCRVCYDEMDNWTTLDQFACGRSESPFWAMPQLKMVWKEIEMLKDRFNIDENRLYITGVSSGGFGATVLAMEHPHVFAAVVPVSCASNPAKMDALRGTALWIFHADDDLLIVPSWSLDPTLAALNAHGVEYRLTRYPKGRIFWQSGHFCWEAAYQEPEMREWVFAQRRN